MRHLPHHVRPARARALVLALLLCVAAACQPTDPALRSDGSHAADSATDRAALEAPSVPVEPDTLVAGEQRPPAEAPISVRWIAPRAGLVRGEETMLGVRLVLAEGWHVYWPGQNDSGAPLLVEPELAAGLTAGDLLWPPPERHLGAGDVLDHVLHDAVTLLLPVSVSDDAPLGEHSLRARVDWIVCRDVCLMDGGEIELSLPVLEAGASPTERAPDAALLRAARRRLPGPEPSGLSVQRTGDAITLRLAGAAALVFFPAASGLPLQDILPTCATEGDTLALRHDARQHGGSSLRGVLRVERTSGAPSFHLVDRELP